MKKFKKGDEVVLSVIIAGITTYEDAVVSRVNKDGVWLDNGPGNDESGPFNKHDGYREVFLGAQRIEHKKKKDVRQKKS